MDTNLIHDFLTSGRAVGTLKSNATGTHFTYRVNKNKKEDGMYFVSLLTGPNNESDYSYLGLMLKMPVTGALGFRVTQKSCAGNDAASVKAFRWMLGKVNRELDLEPQGEFQHEGRCGRCSRTLTDPESIRTGLGPICRTKM